MTAVAGGVGRARPSAIPQPCRHTGSYPLPQRPACRQPVARTLSMAYAPVSPQRTGTRSRTRPRPTEGIPRRRRRDRATGRVEALDDTPQSTPDEDVNLPMLVNVERSICRSCGELHDPDGPCTQVHCPICGEVHSADGCDPADLAFIDAIRSRRCHRRHDDPDEATRLYRGEELLSIWADDDLPDDPFSE